MFIKFVEGLNIGEKTNI